jgi:hypothetical protein
VSQTFKIAPQVTPSRSSTLQQATIRKTPAAQIDFDKNNTPHGNSLAVAKECIYCIAKRVCIQSSHDLTTKTKISDRFGGLPQSDKSQDYSELAKGMTVTVRNIDDDSHRGPKRTVQIAN